MSIEIYHGDCLEIMPTLTAPVDMILADLPYGTTQCFWDSIIPFAPLWENYRRLIKPNGAIVLTASQPFTSALVMSNPDWFRYEWIWEKTMPTAFCHAKNKPLKAHENILIFSPGVCNHANLSSSRMSYNPQGLQRISRVRSGVRRAYWHGDISACKGARPSDNRSYEAENTNYPTSILRFSNSNFETVHPTQKPVALMEYLIRTYTQAGETILDNTCGSGTTGVACVRTGRNFIGIEKAPTYFKIAERRISEAQAQGRLDLDEPPPMKVKQEAFEMT